jgi:hypothetical protein
MKKSFLSTFIILLAIPVLSIAQEQAAGELYFEVSRVYDYISVTKEKLKEAQTISDLNRHYKSTWVKEFLSVEVSATVNAASVSAWGKSDQLNADQKALMVKADAGTTITVIMKYIPDNTLKHNDPKMYDFSFTVEPEQDASYYGGMPALKQYLKETAIDKIPSGTFEGYDLVSVKFTINEAGEVQNAKVFWPFKNEKVDELLLEAIQNMPCWKPATYANGLNIEQEFALAVGNMENCSVHLLNFPKE